MAGDVVLDASAMVDLLLGGSAAHRIADRLAGAILHAPAHFDAEVLSALGRLQRAGGLTADQVELRLGHLARANLVRHPVAPLLAPAWAVRDRVGPVDALYVVLAETLGCPLITTDRRLAAVVPLAEVVSDAIVVEVDPGRVTPSDVAEAAALLQAGGLVAFPTETVYGLGANALDPGAVARVFTAKGRPADNPMIVHAPDAPSAWRATSGPTPLAERLAARFWPGPLTLVLEAAPDLPPAATAGLSSVAVRVPDHPVALALLRAAGVPVAAPSANRSGRPSPTTAAHVLADLGGAVDLIVDGGPCAVGVESTVVDARGARPVVLREGGVSREQLAAAMRPGIEPTAPGTAGLATPITPSHEPVAAGATTSDPGAPDLVASPGTRHRHYAPTCRVVIAAPGSGGAVSAGLAADPARRVGLVARDAAPAGVRGVARFADAEDLAARLYSALRDADATGLTDLVVEAVPETGIGRAVMDRLRRAAEGSGPVSR